MQKKRNIRLLILLAILLVATVTIFFSFRNESEPITDKTIFRVEDFNQIDQIVLTKGNKTVDLKFEGSRWKVNGHLADRRMIDVLFATLQQAEPKRPVAQSMQASVDSILKDQGVKVSLYSSGEIQKEFLAGGNASKTQAYFKNVSNDQIYLTIIPGYRVYTSGIFELDENGWKDKYVFNFNWKNFQSLKTSFPDNPKEDFEVTQGKDYFEIKGIATDTARLNDFLDQVSLLTVDRYVDKSQVVYSAVQPKLIVKLEVSDISGRTLSLQLFQIGDNPSVLAGIGDEQFAYIDRRKVAGIVKNRNWFVKK